MKVYVFNEQEMEAIRDIVETSYGLSIQGIEMSFGEHLEDLINDTNIRNMMNLDILQFYIKQLKLMKKFYLFFGLTLLLLKKL